MNTYNPLNRSRANEYFNYCPHLRRGPVNELLDIFSKIDITRRFPSRPHSKTLGFGPDFADKFDKSQILGHRDNSCFTN